VVFPAWPSIFDAFCRHLKKVEIDDCTFPSIAFLAATLWGLCEVFPRLQGKRGRSQIFTSMRGKRWLVKCRGSKSYHGVSQMKVFEPREERRGRTSPASRSASALMSNQYSWSGLTILQQRAKIAKLSLYEVEQGTVVGFSVEAGHFCQDEVLNVMSTGNP